jgi:hypothetical protein
MLEIIKLLLNKKGEVEKKSVSLLYLDLHEEIVNGSTAINSQ